MSKTKRMSASQMYHAGKINRTEYEKRIARRGNKTASRPKARAPSRNKAMTKAMLYHEGKITRAEYERAIKQRSYTPMSRVLGKKIKRK